MNAALLHFLWQGAAIAFLLSVALVWVKTARVRYVLACAALLAMPLAFGLTLWLSQPAEPRMVRLPVFFTIPPPSLDSTALEPGPWSPDPASWWMAGVSILYCYRAIGWLAAQRLRRRGVCAASPAWQQRVVDLGSRIRQTRPVLLLESAFAETPMTIGLWRPVVLMPLGLLAGLPSTQVEAILLHELAHIRRHDYLVNLLQAAIEGLLFYHPATWWVSHIIRRERENCCDDLAVAATGDALAYTRALAALEEHRVRVPILAVTGGPLMSRIQRLLGQPSRLSPAPALLFLTLAAGVALYAFEPLPFPLPEPVPAPAPEPAPEPGPNPTPAPAPQQAPVSPTPAAQTAPNLTRDQTEALLRDTLETPYKKWLNEDVIWIVLPEERTAFNRLQTDDERQQFIEQFWLRRDPTPDTSLNEFKQEHYRRIAWANDRFTSLIPGWKTDRGMVYVKFGPPDEREEHPAGSPQSTFFPYERWRYRSLEGVGQDVIIEFVDKARNNEYRMTWNPSDKDALLRVPGAGLTLYEQMGLADKNDRFSTANPMMLGYGPLSGTAQRNMFDRLQRFVNLEKAPSIKFKDLDEVVNSAVRSNLLRMQVQTDYLPVTESTVNASVTVQFDRADLQFRQKDGMAEGLINLTARIATMTGRRIGRAIEVLLEVRGPAEELAKLRQGKANYRFTAPLFPGQYTLTVVAKDVVGDSLGSYDVVLNVPAIDNLQRFVAPPKPAQ